MSNQELKNQNIFKIVWYEKEISKFSKYCDLYL